MKKLAVTLCLSAVAVSAFAQGTVNYLNGPTTLISTNSSALSSGGTGPTATTAGGFFYALFTAPTTTTSIGSISELLSGGWTFSGLYAANTAATTGGRFTGGGGVATSQGWAAGVSQSYVILGWSAGLGAQNTNILARLNGATLSGGMWSGGGLTGADNGQFIGLSPIGNGAAGGGASGFPAFGLFGAPSGQGNPIQTGYSLYVVNVPEPTTFALAGLGAAALVIFRRRKV